MNEKWFVVNTWQTRLRPQIFWDGYYPTQVELQKIINKVSELKVKFALPKYFSALSLPRYYCIVFRDDEDIEIVDIVGVKADLTPTKWSYQFGYWHPYCQVLVLDSLKQLELELLEKEKEEVKTPA